VCHIHLQAAVAVDGSGTRAALVTLKATAVDGKIGAHSCDTAPNVVGEAAVDDVDRAIG